MNFSKKWSGENLTNWTGGTIRDVGVCTYLCVCVCVCVCVYVCIYVQVCAMHVHIYDNVFVHMYTYGTAGTYSVSNNNFGVIYPGSCVYACDETY